MPEAAKRKTTSEVEANPLARSIVAGSVWTDATNPNSLRGFSTDRQHRAQPRDRSRQHFQRPIDLRLRGIPRQAESNRPVRDLVLDLHRAQHVRRFEAAAGTGGAGAGADALLAEQEQDRLGLE